MHHRPIQYCAIVCVAILLLAAGCAAPPGTGTPTPTQTPPTSATPTETATTTPTPAATSAPIPRITITAPLDGATVPYGPLQVRVDVENLVLTNKLGGANVAGEGHIHYFLDATPPTEPGKPAVTAPGTYAATNTTVYTWTGIAPGSHTLSVELVNNDHTPLTPRSQQRLP